MSGREGKTRTERYSFSIESSGGRDTQINDSGLSADGKVASYLNKAHVKDETNYNVDEPGQGNEGNYQTRSRVHAIRSMGREG